MIIYGYRMTLPFFLCKFNIQAFINYNFLYTRFCACKTVLGAHRCTWEIVPIKEQMCTLLIITLCSNRKCTKLVLKLLAAKNGLSISVLCIAPFVHDGYPPFLSTTQCIYIA